MNNIYNLYITFGTIPSLYAKINTILYAKNNYVWTRNISNFLVNEKLEYYYQLNTNDNLFLENDYLDIVNKILEIKKKDKKARFRIYIDDSRVQFLLKPLIIANIYNNIFEIIMISEGNITEYMFNDISIKDEILQEKNWNNLINLIKQNSNQMNDELSKISNYSYWFSTQKNVKYLVPKIELLENPLVNKKYFENMNLINFDLEKLFDSLSTKEKKQLYPDLNYFLKLYDWNKTIIILGTYDFGPKNYTSYIYENLIDQTLHDFKEYKFIFKAHPLYPVSSNKRLETYLQKRNINVFDNKIPIELLLWENKNILIGGFCSSVNSLIDSERTKFFYGERIGFAKLMENNNLYNFKEYNVLVSQKMALEMTRLYYENIDYIKSYNSELLLRIKNLEEIIKNNNLYYENTFKNIYNLINKKENVIIKIYRFFKRKINKKNG